MALKKNQCTLESLSDEKFIIGKFYCCIEVNFYRFPIKIARSRQNNVFHFTYVIFFSLFVVTEEVHVF